jgi:DNA-binding Xre family transcriptional regulator
MLKLDLQRIFEDKGIENPNQYLVKNGLTPHTVSRLLHNRVSSISFKHLEKICLLLNCTIDDLFAWENPDKSDTLKDHSLQKLKRGKKKGNIAGKLKALPASKLGQVRDFIEELTKN